MDLTGKKKLNFDNVSDNLQILKRSLSSDGIQSRDPGFLPVGVSVGATVDPERCRCLTTHL